MRARSSMPCGWVSWMTCWPTVQRRPRSRRCPRADRPVLERSGDDEGLVGAARLEGVECRAVADRAGGDAGRRGVGVEARRLGDAQDLAGARVEHHQHARRWPSLSSTARSSAFSATYCTWRSRVRVTVAPCRSTASGAPWSRRLRPRASRVPCTFSLSPGQLVFEGELEARRARGRRCRPRPARGRRARAAGRNGGAPWPRRGRGCPAAAPRRAPAASPDASPRRSGGRGRAGPGARRRRGAAPGPARARHAGGPAPARGRARSSPPPRSGPAGCRGGRRCRRGGRGSPSPAPTGPWPSRRAGPAGALEG